MRGLLLALAAVPEPDVFVEAEIAVTFVLHPPNVAGTDAVILQPYELFDGDVAVAKLFGNVYLSEPLPDGSPVTGLDLLLTSLPHCRQR